MMARTDARAAAALRVPSHARRQSAETKGDDGRPRLRLVVTRGRLGIELDAPWSLGPLVVEELSLSLPHVRFPVELSGGVGAFRNKRGELERLVVRLDAKAVHRFARARLATVVPGITLNHHLLAPLDDGWLVGIGGPSAALAFEVRIAPNDGDVRLLPVAARGFGMPSPACTLATRVLFALAKPFGKLAGGAVVLEGAPEAIARTLLPAAGMRAPAARGMRWTTVAADVDGVTLSAERDGVIWAAPERVQRDIELLTLVAEGDAAMLTGRSDHARRAYIEAAMEAPRHPEVARRLADLDRTSGDRVEAALVALTDAMPATEAGLLGGALLAASGDRDGARVALRRAAQEEAYGPLAGLAWLELAAASDDEDQHELLDEAVARAPSSAQARWRRIDHALSQGDVDRARGDVQHLEVQADGPGERHEVLRRAAARLLAHHAQDEAAAMFERSLRYQPGSIEAVAGLARCFQTMGHERRALELFARATTLADRAKKTAPRVTIDLAKALVGIAGDRPAAIARVRSVASFHPAAFEARSLEARWRAELGDLAGAGVALARLADAVEAALGVLLGERAGSGPMSELWSADGAPEGVYATVADARSEVASMLEDGARIHELDRGDLPASRRLLALAVRLVPQHRRIGGAFRRVAASVDRVAESVDDDPTPHEAMPVTSPSAFPIEPERGPEPIGAAAPVDRPDALDGLDIDELGTMDDQPGADDEIAVEDLTNKLRADPSDDDTAMALLGVLERLGRDLDLLALVSARVEETAGDLRATWVKRRHAVLQRMVDRAKETGRDDEAELYALMLQRD
jgi:tetratricopeptide (TPR) repeat protein